ncbi:hypothetical protein J416_06505 [Gracilibacillus halophilus YIM-C55.5]|uniref:DUF262 domain-containing protein n=1 Tax=Gracilibacillus halophilus YIM-C55.5 TaxID=1308866 RepID=N4WAC5_9BACI|nr:DUF262 domain-containing protein [Gracilibacillus halophilus]ENH97263.1 hypothetical protein J416_06505 [Gracilibacillus halophilus YIM-C55.5]
MENIIKVMSVSNVFDNVHYEIPIYQRNYAWEEVQIEQLIEDIHSAENDYFLGNLIVNQKDNDVYEVIDGQQRLTTIYLLEKYLGLAFLKDALRFEAREKSNRTLRFISDGASNDMQEELLSTEIINGYQMIENYFIKENIDKSAFKKKLDQVKLIRVQVPPNIDLNHYFEIMNTRGEQLELHEIAKAKLLSVLTTAQDKRTAAFIWEICANMNSYVQMNADVTNREKLFTKDWSSLNDSVNKFDDIKTILPDENEEVEKSKTLLDILEKPEYKEIKTEQDEPENERFESTVTFPNFILQVNTVLQKKVDEDASLDDKNFLDNISWAWSNEKQAKDFLYHLLKCRVLFDKYVLKREFVRDYKETGRWSLQRLEKYTDKHGAKPKYVGTFGGDDAQKNKQIRTLQACLRITYTSPKTMHWIPLLLATLLEDETSDILTTLEDYCNEKVQESNFTNASGFRIERIVFSYLDYLLYRDGYSYKDNKIISPLQEDWQFSFRTSIEHFNPQNPVAGATWESSDLDSFGNLALVTVSGNSKFSNLPPAGKVNSYPSIVHQSLKLIIMKEMMYINQGVWDVEISEIHKDDMYQILQG